MAMSAFSRTKKARMVSNQIANNSTAVHNVGMHYARQNETRKEYYARLKAQNAATGKGNLWAGSTMTHDTPMGTYQPEPIFRPRG